jgi:hypothetical protein
MTMEQTGRTSVLTGWQCGADDSCVLPDSPIEISAVLSDSYGEAWVPDVKASERTRELGRHDIGRVLPMHRDRTVLPSRDPMPSS